MDAPLERVWVQSPLEKHDFFSLFNHYYKLFMYVSITNNDKEESKVLGDLLPITLNLAGSVCKDL